MILICTLQLGGTIGDIEGMPFVEAFRQFQFRVKRENFMNVHVSLVPEVLFLMDCHLTTPLISTDMLSKWC